MVKQLGPPLQMIEHPVLILYVGQNLVVLIPATALPKAAQCKLFEGFYYLPYLRFLILCFRGPDVACLSVFPSLGLGELFRL